MISSVEPSKQSMFSGKIRETKLAYVFYGGLIYLKLLTLIKRLLSSDLLRMIMRCLNLDWLLLILCNFMWADFEIKCIMHKLLDSSVAKKKEKKLHKGTLLQPSFCGFLMFCQELVRENRKKKSPSYNNSCLIWRKSHSFSLNEILYLVL